MQLNCANRILDLSHPVIMAVLNVTPDSFSDGGRYFAKNQLNLDLVLSRVQSMLAEGATIIDVGGESTRPGAKTVGVDEELERTVPIVEAIAQRFDTIISVDTSTPEVMRQTAKAGAGMLNDVRALQREDALQAAAETGLPVCLMHMQGQPDTMQSNPKYDEVVSQVLAFLQERITVCESAGIERSQILVDPGFGFGKTLDNNLALLRELEQFKSLDCSILVGLSRKSMLSELLGRDVDQRLAGSLGLAMVAAQRGANIIRVHDVAATRDVLQILRSIDDNPRP